MIYDAPRPTLIIVYAAVYAGSLQVIRRLESILSLSLSLYRLSFAPLFFELELETCSTYRVSLVLNRLNYFGNYCCPNATRAKRRGNNVIIVESLGDTREKTRRVRATDTAPVEGLFSSGRTSFAARTSLPGGTPRSVYVPIAVNL